jgi:hypothetical protein
MSDAPARRLALPCLALVASVRLAACGAGEPPAAAPPQPRAEPVADAPTTPHVRDAAPRPPPAPPPAPTPPLGGRIDRDGDGVGDRADLCPDDLEDHDGFRDEDGCPDPDNDQDGIADVMDACPNDAEIRNGWQDDDGCPEPVAGPQGP